VGEKSSTSEPMWTGGNEGSSYVLKSAGAKLPCGPYSKRSASMGSRRAALPAG